MILKTKRLILRPWRERDAAALYRYAGDPEVGPAAGWPPHTDVENSRHIIRTALAHPETYAICLHGEPIGSIGLKFGAATDLTDRKDECELGYWLGKPFWGQGLMPEAAREILRHAFEELGARAVWCAHFDGNYKSKRVQEKLGFVFHHTSDQVPVPLLGQVRKGHVRLLTKEHWQEINQG